MKDAAFKSDFAILDVKKGRDTLAKRMRDHGPVRVRVDILLTEIWGDDDGISREFAGEVQVIKEFRPTSGGRTPKKRLARRLPAQRAKEAK